MVHSAFDGSTDNAEISALLTPELYTSFIGLGDDWPAGKVALLYYIWQGQVLTQVKLYPTGIMTVPRVPQVTRWDASGHFEFAAWVNWNYVMTVVQVPGSRGLWR